MKTKTASIVLLFLCQFLFSQMPSVRELTSKELKKQKSDKVKDSIKGIAEKKYNKWFPTLYVNKDEFYEYMYKNDNTDSISVVNDFSLQFTDKSAIAESEIISSAFGPVRFSLGTLITNSETDNTTTAAKNRLITDEVDTDENGTTAAFQRLRSNGGNLYAKIDFPVFCIQNDNLTNTFYTNLYSKGGLVITTLSNDVDSTSGNGSTGLNMYGSLSSNDKSMFLFVNSNFGLYYGSSEFYQKLNLTENKSFLFGQITIGLEIINRMRISYTLNSFSSDKNLRTERGLIGIQILN